MEEFESELLRVFRQAELESKLFDWREGSAPVWELIRYQAFLRILATQQRLVASSANEALHTAPAGGTSGAERKNSSIVESLRRRAYRRLQRRRRSPFRGGQCELLVFGHPRRKFENGVWIDLYVDALLPILGAAFDVRVVEPGWTQHQVPAATSDLRYLDDIDRTISLQRGANAARALSGESLDLAEQIARAVVDGTGVAFDVAAMAEDAVRSWRAAFPAYDGMLERLKPKAVLLVNHIAMQPLIVAARARGIPTIELQHGSPGFGKLNYDYPPNQRCVVFADNFFSFGRFWSRNCHLPLPEERVIPIGFTYLRDRINRFPVRCDTRRAMVISQVTLRPQLAELALALKSLHGTGVDIVWKNHPAEVGLTDGIAQALAGAGIEILPANADLYAEIAAAPTIIGGYSTALFESISFGRRPQVIRARNAEAMATLVAANGADYVAAAEDVSFGASASPQVAEDLFAQRTDDEILSAFKEAIQRGPL